MKSRTFFLGLLVWTLTSTIPVFYVACQAPSTRVVQVQTLKAVGHSAEAAVTSAANLYRDHLITDDQARQVNAFYDTKFQPAFHIAVAAVNANLDSIASPELAGLAAQLSQLVLQFSNKAPTP